jgi:Tol biopolymer transport system component/imidazolonepropionase-like amidohydrolase
MVGFSTGAAGGDSVSPVLLLLALAATSTGKPAPAKVDAAASINTPRADARKIQFDTHEGTWMSVDLSPDGKDLVFDVLGDIYTVGADGGEARALTKGPAWDSQPRFSPDGKTIAFTSDRGGIENIWLMDRDGSNPRALTTEKDAYVRTAAWTPDGDYLVARKEDGKRAGIPPVELWMYHREGGGGIKLTSAEELDNASGPVASPDGRFIYYSGRQKRFSYQPDLSQGLWQVFRYDRLTGQSFPLTEGFGGAGRPALTPDGKGLIFVSRRDENEVLVLRSLETGGETILARGVTRDEQEGFAQMDLWPGYAVSPDSKAVYFSNHGKLQKLDLQTRAVKDIPLTVHVEQWVAPRVAFQDRVETGPVKPRILRWPNQSPDGKWIVFDALGRIWIQELAGSKPVGTPKRLTPDDSSLPAREYAPAFSPDGASIAYVTWSDAEGGHVWRTSPGGKPQKLTTVAGHYANPSWDRKGEKLAVIRGSGLEFRQRQPEEEQVFDILWMDAKGGEGHYVASVGQSAGLRFHPQAFFSQDGARILYRDPVPQKKPTDDPKTDLVSVRLDGTDRKKLLRFPVVGEMVPSPDGAWAAFTSRDEVYVTAIPRIVTAAEPPEISLKDGAVPVWRLSDEAGGFVAWAENGRSLTWAFGPTIHRLRIDDAVAFARKQRAKEQEAGENAAKGKDAKDGKDAKAGAKAEEKDKDKLELPPSETFTIALEQPRPAPTGTFVIKGARVVSMKGDEVLENADVVVSGNRIKAVGPSGQAVVPADAQVLDGHGKTVIPGLIDTHAHMHYSGFEVFPDQKWEYLANLAYGVTTIYDPSAPSSDVFSQAEMIEAGVMEGPRVYSSGDVLYGGQQADVYAEVGSQADALRQVKRMQTYGTRMIKVYQQPRRAQRLYFAEACRELHMLMTAEGAGELETDLSMAMDGFTAFEHSLPVELQGDVVHFLAQTGTYYTPTLIVGYGGPWGEEYFWQTRNPHDDAKLAKFIPHLTLDPLGRRHVWINPEEYHFPTVAQGVAEVLRAGGHVSLGAHGQLQGLGPHWEVWMMAGEGGSERRRGMTPMEALRASTILSADKIGFAADLGSVEAGKLADLIVLDENPLQDIHSTTKIHWVVKNGVVYEGDTLKEVWPKERAVAPFFWQH